MFHRSVDESLVDWMDSGRRAVPLLTGPRGVGKSTAVKALGKRYGRIIELDIGGDANGWRILRGRPDCGELMRRISESHGAEPAAPGDTLVILDEVGYCPDVPGVLSALSSREGIDVVATMSCRRPEPGRADNGFRGTPVEVMNVTPLDFRGFMDACGIPGETVDSLCDDLRAGRRPRRSEEEAVENAFRLYLVAGGMPRAVSAVAEGHISDVLSVSESVLAEQMDDARRMLPDIHDVVIGCMRSVPSQLAGNGRFIYSKVERVESHGSRDCKAGISWLSSSGILEICQRMREDSVPGIMRTDPVNFKAYTDCGTLACLMDRWTSDAVMHGDYSGCAVVENCLAKTLSSAGLRHPYYSRDRREADFVVAHGKRMTAAAVRSGSNDRRKSLKHLIDCGIATDSVEFGDFGKTGGPGRLPFYAAGLPDVAFPA